MSKNFSLIHFKVKFTFQNNLSNMIEWPRFPQIVPTSGSSNSTGHPLHMDGQDDECVSDIGPITRFSVARTAGVPPHILDVPTQTHRTGQRCESILPAFVAVILFVVSRGNPSARLSIVWPVV